jgi:hypothetical protein
MFLVLQVSETQWVLVLVFVEENRVVVVFAPERTLAVASALEMLEVSELEILRLVVVLVQGKQIVPILL